MEKEIEELEKTIKEIRKQLYTLENETVSILRRLFSLGEETIKIYNKIKWIIQQKSKLAYRIYKFTKEYNMTIIQSYPDNTLIIIEEDLARLISNLNKLLKNIQWLETAFNESINDYLEEKLK